ncbi:MAG TPA: ribosome maturation factor RimP [Pyrinomonadaceae bacterium]|nr:ribosome maturation factor RimP [Pyrinomonadaceae bacterium]
MDKHLVIERVGNIAAKVAAETGVELVHVEIAGIKHDMVVRVYIDKTEGVTIDDCSRFSKAAEEILDAEDIVPTKYVLEVSSPGIERELYSLADFVKFTGKLAKVKTAAAIGGQKIFIGEIVEAGDEQIVIDDRTQGKVTFKYEDVSKANLRIDLAKEFSR